MTANALRFDRLGLFVASPVGDMVILVRERASRASSVNEQCASANLQKC